LVLAVLSPLERISTRSFAAHMVQHEVLMLVAAPLLVLGRPLAAWREPAGRCAALPVHRSIPARSARC
jgi:putative membrane protein